MAVRYLVEVGHGLALASAVVVWDINELEVMRKARVGTEELWRSCHVWQITEILIPPVVQLCQGWPGTPLWQHYVSTITIKRLDCKESLCATLDTVLLSEPAQYWHIATGTILPIEAEQKSGYGGQDPTQEGIWHLSIELDVWGAQADEAGE